MSNKESISIITQISADKKGELIFLRQNSESLEDSLNGLNT